MVRSSVGQEIFFQGSRPALGNHQAAYSGGAITPFPGEKRSKAGERKFVQSTALVDKCRNVPVACSTHSDRANSVKHVKIFVLNLKISYCWQVRNF